MSRSKKGGRNGRQRNALVYLENKLMKWKSHNYDFESKNPLKRNTRTHEEEQVRLEREIANLKAKLKIG